MNLKHLALTPVLAIAGLLNLLPYFMRKGLQQLIFTLLFRVFNYRYNVVLQNLSRSLPGKSYAEIKSIAIKFYRHFSGLFLEITALMVTPAKRLKRHLHIVNPELPAAYWNQRNVVLMLGHYGNWECLNVLPQFFPVDVYAVYKPLSSGYFDSLMYHVRTRFGMKLLPAGQVARHMLLHRDQPSVYIFIADQSPPPGAKCKVDFLHQPTSLFAGAEKLAKALDAVVLYTTVKKNEELRRWEVSFSLLTEEPATHEIMRSFAAHLERDILHDPPYWLWTHRRWKHQNQ